MYNRNRYTIDNTIFKIAIYIRLSREDGDDLESESVTNQRSLLIGYLKAQGLVAVDIYVDDGYTGTNFEPEYLYIIGVGNSSLVSISAICELP